MATRMSRLLAAARSARTYLHSERGQRQGEAVLKKAASAADRATGSRHAARIERARAMAEKGLRKL